MARCHILRVNSVCRVFAESVCTFQLFIKMGPGRPGRAIPRWLPSGTRYGSRMLEVRQFGVRSRDVYYEAVPDDIARKLPTREWIRGEGDTMFSRLVAAAMSPVPLLYIRDASASEALLQVNTQDVNDGGAHNRLCLSPPMPTRLRVIAGAIVCSNLERVSYGSCDRRIVTRWHLGFLMWTHHQGIP